MALTMDPAGNEVRALRRVMNWQGAHVLEIGCGGGRLTQRLVSLGVANVHALDNDAELIETARKQLPARYAKQIEYQVGSGAELKHDTNTFDVVVFSWVL